MAEEPLFQYITGPAGTGKTRLVRDRFLADPKYGVFSATTGIAAVNLDTTTLNAVLGYFDLDSIQDSYAAGHLQARITKIAKKAQRLLVDEISMLHHGVLDIVVDSIDEYNERKTTEKPFGMTLVGDFCQLPPIPEQKAGRDKRAYREIPWAFNARNWSRFAENITRLTKFWRQTDTDFLEALQFARCGNGVEAARVLSNIPAVDWRRTLDFNFDGTTIVATNDEAERINKMVISNLPGKMLPALGKQEEGLQRGEWRHIPDKLELKIGAYVMILVNDQDPMHRALGMMDYANGSCGHVVEVNQRGYRVELMENGQPGGKTVEITPIEREYTSREKTMQLGKRVVQPLRYDDRKRRYVYGTVTYMPLRLAYASTVHKSQGLTLDKVQIDLRHHFMGSPAMVYVGLSRCKTPGGLTIVGRPEDLARRCSIHEEVIPWL